MTFGSAPTPRAPKRRASLLRARGVIRRGCLPRTSSALKAVRLCSITLTEKNSELIPRPHFPRRTMIAGMVTALAVTFSSACSGQTQTVNNDLGLVSPGVLTVAAASSQVPYSYIDSSGKLTGFTHDLINQIASRIGLKVREVPLSFAATLPAIASHQYDTSTTAINVTPERERMVAFTQAHSLSYLALVVPQESKTISLSEMGGKSIAVTSGSVEEDYLRKHFPNVQIKGFTAIPDERAALVSGQVDGWLTSGAMAEHIATPDSRMRVGERIDLGAVNAFPVAKDNPALVAAINKQMDAMFADGTYEKLFTSYFHRPVPEGLRAGHLSSPSPSADEQP